MYSSEEDTSMLDENQKNVKVANGNSENGEKHYPTAGSSAKGIFAQVIISNCISLFL